MNRVFATVWNHSLCAWVVASEHATRQGKRGARRHSVPALALLCSATFAPLYSLAADLPSGGQIVQGSGQIGTPNGNQMVIDQSSNQLAINWQSFDIGAGSKVTFKQPGAASIALNRVLGADGSKIMGQLDANGRVFIINPNGVLFGQNASVNVGGLVASTLDISDADFAAGNYRFKGDGSNAAVINQGTLKASDGGAIALLGGTVSNQGVIVANRGTVALAAGNKITLDFAGDGLLNVQVDEAAVDALVENRQLIKANGGQVLLTANAGEALLKTVVNNTGVIEAQTLGEKDGKIVLLGGFDGGTVQVAGTLDASAPTGGNGGFIETSGAHVQIADTAKVTTKAQSGKTGTWLIDPNDFTIAASGGNMTGAAVSTAVQNNNFEIQTATQGSSGGNGDILVNDALSWSNGNTLTLTAERNIEINTSITATNGGLTLKAQNTISTSANGAVNVGTFTLASGNWKQLGSTLPAFSARDFRLSGGSFLRALDGDGSSASPWQLTDVYGLQGMGGFLAKHFSLANNIDASGTASWNSALGFNPIGTFNSRYSGTFDGLGQTISGLTINRPAQDYVGLFGAISSPTIRNIGLLGGSISGKDYVGGLVGYNAGTGTGTISNAYATGAVTGSSYVGGLVGIHFGDTISNAYATGAVMGSNNVGGLVGYNSRGIISSVYATGAVTGSTDVGGLVGFNHLGNISQSYWDITRSGQSTSAGGGTGLTTAQMMNSASFADWNVATSGGSEAVWRIYEGQTGPLLRSFLTAVTVTPSGLTGKTYDGTLASGTFTYTPSLAGAVLDGSATYTSQSANAGTYSAANGGLTLGLYSGQQGYDISYASDSSLTITPKALTMSGVTVDSKTYDGTTVASISGGSLSGYVSGETLITVSSASFSDKNAGNGKTVTVATTLANGGGGGLAANYTINNPTGVTANISKATISGVSNIVANSKVYDGNTIATASPTGATFNGMIAGDDLALSATSATFADKNASNGKTVAFSGMTLGGADAGNYNLASTTGSGTGNITPKALSIAGISAVNKVYDGSTRASLSGGSISGLVGAETLGVTGLSATFDDKNAGANKTVTASGSVLVNGGNGGLASNYTISNPTGLIANITPKALTVSGVSASNKVYDGNTGAVVVGGTLNGLVAGETLNLNDMTGTFADKNAGTGKMVTVSGATLADGSGLASNYTVAQPVAVTATINKAGLTVTANDAHKTYNGLTWSGGNGVSYGGFVNGENSSVLDGSLVYGGTSQGAINVGSYGLDVSGLASSNYAISFVNGALTINAATLPPQTPTTPSLTPFAPYLWALNGTIIIANAGGSTSFSPGQFGYAPSAATPSTLAPSSPGMIFSPPPVLALSALPFTETVPTPELVAGTFIIADGIRLPEGI